MNESFVFYRSFAEALENLPAEQYKEVMTALSRYALDGEMPEGIDAVSMAMFLLMKPQIDANNKRRESGKNGGDAKARVAKASKPLANSSNSVAKSSKPLANCSKDVANASKHIANANVNANVNVNDIHTCASDNAQERSLEPTEDAADLLFEELWSIYPQKRGKSSVSRTTKLKLLKHGREQMIRAVNRYVDECNAEKRYIKNGSTFFNGSYADYLDDTFTPIVSKKTFDRDDKLGEWQGTDYDAAVLDRLGGSYVV